MSDVIYQYQQAYVPNNGNTFHFWVDCTKEIHDEEAREGGTVRTLYAAPPAPVLRVPDGWKLVPSALTAENGAKAALLGEFNIEYNLQCHECFGEGCDNCDGEGRWVKSIPVDWTTIKAIWAKGVEHFQEVPPEASNEQ